MAHWAEINSNNEVIRILVTDNSLPNEGLDWLQNRLGGTWIQTSYNTFGNEHLLGGTPLRKNFAAIGDKFDPKRDAFISPQPFKSWVLNEDTCRWEAPIPKPNDTKKYEWDEPTLSWLEIGE